jgi:hypothetical protein
MDLTTYSAKVALTLIVKGAPINLSQVGPSEIVVLDDCEPIPPCEAELRIRVDNSRKKKRIYLPMGIPGPRQPVPYF